MYDAHFESQIAPESRGTHLRLTKRGPDCARPGRPLVYTLTVTNLGPAAAHEVLVTDFLSADLEQPQFSPDAGLNWQPWPGCFSLDTLEPGQRRSLLLSGRVAPCACGSIFNRATVSSLTPELSPGDNTAVTLTPVVQAGD